MSRQTTVDIKYAHIYWLFLGIIFNNNGTRRKKSFDDVKRARRDADHETCTDGEII